ncbi:MAG: helix-turn-helix domain-containing protein [Clostridia bacterium]
MSKIFEKARDVRLSRRILVDFEQQLKKLPHKLTVAQMSVLYATDRDHECSQKKICDVTGIDRSTTANVVRRLEAKGLVTVKASNHDRRANCVRLTKDGKKALIEALRLETKFFAAK